MKNYLRGSLLWTLLLALVVLAFLLGTEAFPPQLQIGPRLVAGTTVLLLLVLLVGEFYPAINTWTEVALQDLWGGGNGDESAAAVHIDEEPPPWSAAIRMMLYAVGFFVLVLLLGFFAIPPIFIALFLILEADVRPFRAISLAIIVSISLNLAMLALNVEVFTGIVPEIIPGFLGGAIMPPL